MAKYATASSISRVEERDPHSRDGARRQLVDLIGGRPSFESDGNQESFPEGQLVQRTRFMAASALA